MKIILDVATQFMGPLTQGIPCSLVRLVEQPDGSFGLMLQQPEGQPNEGLPSDVQALICPVCKLPLSAHQTPCRA